MVSNRIEVVLSFISLAFTSSRNTLWSFLLVDLVSCTGGEHHPQEVSQHDGGHERQDPSLCQSAASPEV